MNLSEQVTKNNLYKTFEPYIDPAVTMKERLAGHVRLTAHARGHHHGSCLAQHLLP